MGWNDKVDTDPGRATRAQDQSHCGVPSWRWRRPEAGEQPEGLAVQPEQHSKSYMSAPNRDS